MRTHVLAGLLASMAALLGIGAPGQAQKEVTMLKPADFAVMAWGGAPGDRQALLTMKECGINLVGFVRVEDLDLVREAGLMALVSDGTTHAGDAEAALPQEEIQKRVDALVQRVAGHPAVMGYYLRDEPSSVVYPGLRRWADAVRKAAPGALPYINLFPNYASPGQMGVPTYDEYVEKYVTTVAPPFLSYDHYALMDDGTLRDGYFQNLESMRRASLKHNLPFWNIVLSNAHFHYAEPTYGGMRFQVYTSLAYGARGISYFTYFAPSIGNYRLAPIDQFGSRTPTWDMLRSVNQQIHALGPTYIQLKSVNVFHHPEPPEGSQGMGSSRFVEELSGGNLLVGEFEGPGSKAYVLVVNKDLHRSTAFSVKFKGGGRVMQVNSYTGGVGPWAGENNWLAAGQGMLLFRD